MPDSLNEQVYEEHPVIKELIATCRTHIIGARIKLASERALNRNRRAELWQFIDSRELFMKMLSENFAGELERVDRELERELSRS